MNESTDPAAAPVRTPEQIKKDMRILGVIMAVGGGLVAAGLIGWPTYQAQQGAESIRLFPKACFAGIAFFYWGVLTAILGKVPMPPLESKASEVAGKQWAFIVLGVALVGVSIFFAYRHFASLGYAIS